VYNKQHYRLNKAERCKPLATLQTKKNMSDQIIFDVDGLIEAQIRQRDKDYAKVCCQNLLNYAYGKGLLCDNPCDNEGNLIMPSIIKESSLTEIGKHIFVELLFKWFAYTDNESGKIDRKNNIKMLEKYYNQLLQKIDRK
ncbi:hypothetical protein, partial [Bacteroides uniformis]